jgi:hypothetical protein
MDGHLGTLVECEYFISRISLQRHDLLLFLFTSCLLFLFFPPVLFRWEIGTSVGFGWMDGWMDETVGTRRIQETSLTASQLFCSTSFAGSFIAPPRRGRFGLIWFVG